MSLPSLEQLRELAKVIELERPNVASFIADYLGRTRDERQKDRKEREVERKATNFWPDWNRIAKKTGERNVSQNSLQIFKLAQPRI